MHSNSAYMQGLCITGLASLSSPLPILYIFSVFIFTVQLLFNCSVSFAFGERSLNLNSHNVLLNALVECF